MFFVFISIIVLFIPLTLRKTKSTYELNPRFREAFLHEYDLASYLSFTLFLVGFICGGVGNLNIISKVIGYIIPPYLNRITRHIKFYFVLEDI